MKYLIVGLGNIGLEHENTRHNVGFKILDALVSASNICFTPKRYGDVAEYKFKGRRLILLKPSTYMNLSGKAINYWLQKEKIPEENLLVLTDDISLPLGSLRLRSKGSDAGHNGLKNIIEILGHLNFSRLRFGIGSEFSQGQQINYVLGEWTEEEKEQIPELAKTCHQIIKSFCTIGIGRTMNQFNKRKQKAKDDQQ